MRLHHIALLATVAAGTFVLGTQLATGHDAPAIQEPACSLITKAEAEAALKKPVTVSDNGKTCGFTVTEPGRFMSLSAHVGPDGVSAANFAAAVAAYAKAANATAREIDDLGDAAWATLGPQLSQVIARSGDRFVTIVFVNVGLPTDERVAAMSALARTALGRAG